MSSLDPSRPNARSSPTQTGADAERRTKRTGFAPWRSATYAGSPAAAVRFWDAGHQRRPSADTSSRSGAVAEPAREREAEAAEPAGVPEVDAQARGRGAAPAGGGAAVDRLRGGAAVGGGGPGEREVHRQARALMRRRSRRQGHGQCCRHGEDRPLHPVPSHRHRLPPSRWCAFDSERYYPIFSCGRATSASGGIRLLERGAQVAIGRREKAAREPYCVEIVVGARARCRRRRARRCGPRGRRAGSASASRSRTARRRARRAARSRAARARRVTDSAASGSSST